MQEENQSKKNNDSQRKPQVNDPTQQSLPKGQFIEYIPENYYPQPVKPKSASVALIVFAIFGAIFVVAIILAILAIPVYSGIVDESKWSEGKTAVGCIKNALDVYLAANNDFSELNCDSGLDFPDKTPAHGYLVENNVGLGFNWFYSLQYFKAADFMICIDKTVDAPAYNIWVKTSEDGRSPRSEGYAYRGVHKSGVTVTWWKSANPPANPIELPEFYVTW